MKDRPVVIVVLSKYKEILNPFAASCNKYAPSTPVVCVLDGLHDFEEDKLNTVPWMFVKGPETFSMAGNGNLGLKAAPPDADVLYCGDDVRFMQPDTVRQLQRVAYFNNKIGILSPKLLGRASPALAMPPEGSSFTYVAPLEMWFPCVYIKREVLDKVGYLDERFNQFGGDDLDYCIRVQQAGYKLAVTPRVTVLHEASPEGGPTTFVKNLGVEEWQRQQSSAFDKLSEKYNVDRKTFDLFLRTNDLRLLDPSAVPPSDEPAAVPRSGAERTFSMEGKRGLEGKSLLLMTPMYGGQCTMNFVISFLNLILACQRYNVQVEYMFLHNESLVTRARNRLVDYWMKKSKATHGVFIDADIGFEASDVLATLDLDLDIAGFPCVKKAIRLDRVQELIRKNGRVYTPEELSKISGDFILNFAEWTGRKTFNLGEPQEAHSVGTGLMVIRRNVLERLAELNPERWYSSEHTDAAALPGKTFDFFQVGINPETRDYDSEDYRFCIEARKAGFGVWIIPWAVTSHAGTHLYAGDLPLMAKLMPEWAR